MNCDTNSTMFTLKNEITKVAYHYSCLLSGSHQTKLKDLLQSGSLMTFLFLQEEPRLWRAVLVICKLNVLFTQHHFWAEVQMRLSVTPHHAKGRLPSDSVVLCVAPGVYLSCLGWREITNMTGKMKVDIWGTSTEKGNSYMNDLCTTVLPYCAPSSLLLQHFTSLVSTFPFCYHSLMGDIWIIIILLSPTVTLTKTFQV